MLIDNRFGGPVHIPRVIHNDDGSTAHAGVLTLPPVFVRSRISCGRERPPVQIPSTACRPS